MTSSNLTLAGAVQWGVVCAGEQCVASANGSSLSGSRAAINHLSGISRAAAGFSRRRRLGAPVQNTFWEGRAVVDGFARFDAALPSDAFTTKRNRSGCGAKEVGLAARGAEVVRLPVDQTSRFLLTSVRARS